MTKSARNLAVIIAAIWAVIPVIFPPSQSYYGVLNTFILAFPAWVFLLLIAMSSLKTSPVRTDLKSSLLPLHLSWLLPLIVFIVYLLATGSKLFPENFLQYFLIQVGILIISAMLLNKSLDWKRGGLYSVIYVFLSLTLPNFWTIVFPSLFILGKSFWG